MFKLSFTIGIIGAAAALAACGESNDTTSFGGGASGTDGGKASGGASAGASGGGNTSSAGAGGGSTAGAGGNSTAGSGGTGGGSSVAGAGGTGGGASTDGGAAGASGSSGSGGTDGGAACVRGVECTGFPTTWVRGCTNDDSCVGEVHQTDCCGALQVMGMNHSEASTFCPAERTDCRSQYPAPAGCTSDRVETDTGNTGSLDNVAARCADINQGVGTCTTYVCGTSSTPACPSTRHIGTCG